MRIGDGGDGGCVQFNLIERHLADVLVFQTIFILELLK